MTGPWKRLNPGTGRRGVLPPVFPRWHCNWKQRAAFAEALEKLGRDGPPPSERAAEVVLAVIRGAGG